METNDDEWGSCPNCGASVHVSEMGNERGVVCCKYCYEYEREAQYRENITEESFISYGAGVNSTAIIALYLLGELQGKPEIVFADTGAELPETYEYIEKVSEFLDGVDWGITTIRFDTHADLYRKRSQDTNLYDCLWKMKVVPSFKWLFCNSDYKKDPLKRYADGRTALIGICADERHRAKLDDPSVAYPVLEYTREECANLISRAGLPPAHKTGCYFCPKQRKAHWIRLYKEHPDLWRKSVELEDHALRWRFFSNGRTLQEQMDIWMRAEEMEKPQQ